MKTMKTTCALVTVIISSAQFTSAAVMNTDIAIIGYHADSADSLAWVALDEIATGEVIYFSDTSYRSSSNSFIAEKLIRYTASSTISAGTVMSFSTTTTLPADYETIGASAYSTLDINNNITPLNFATSGDQLVVFQDSDISDTAGFTAITAINVASTQWGSSSTSATESDLYPGLTLGLNALATGSGAGFSDEFDNARYVGTLTSGSKLELLASIYDSSNWEGTNTSQSSGSVSWVTNGVSSFTVTPVPEPSTSLLIGLSSFFLLKRTRK